MAASIFAMRAWNKVTLLLWLAALSCLPQAGFAHDVLSQALSDRELAENIAGASAVIAIRAGSGDTQAAMIEESPFQTAFAIRTIDRNNGTASIDQAATSLMVRATLTMTAPAAF